MKLPPDNVTPEMYAACRKLGVPCVKPRLPRKPHQSKPSKKMSYEEAKRRERIRKRRLRAEFKAKGLTSEGKPKKETAGTSQFMRNIIVGQSFQANEMGKYERYWRAVAHRLGFRLKMDAGTITRIA